MLNNLKNNLHWIFYMLGLLAYIVFISIKPQQFLVAILWLIFIMYSWVVIGILNKKYNFKYFIYTISLTGFVLSIGAFFIYGVEELAYPAGAIRFNIESIIIIFILLLMFSFPTLIIRLGSLKTDSMIFSKKTEPGIPAHIEVEPTIKIKSEYAIEQEWEEATLDDIESGNFEPI